jgi:hypothetical protein
MFPSGDESVEVTNRGLRISQVQAYAYADKMAGTSPELNLWLRALDAHLRSLSSTLVKDKRVPINIRPYYPESFKPPALVGVQFVFELNARGEEEACDAYTSAGAEACE